MKCTNLIFHSPSPETDRYKRTENIRVGRTPVGMSHAHLRHSISVYSLALSFRIYFADSFMMIKKKVVWIFVNFVQKTNLNNYLICSVASDILWFYVLYPNNPNHDC